MRYPSSISEAPPAGALRIFDGESCLVLALCTGKTFVLGRSDGAEIVFAQDRVSRLHGMLWYQAGRWCFRDLGSANGSFVYEVADLDGHDHDDDDLPVESLHKGEGRELTVGEGVLLGTRKARIELIHDVPADAWSTGDPLLTPRGVIEDQATEMFSFHTNAPSSYRRRDISKKSG